MEFIPIIVRLCLLQRCLADVKIYLAGTKYLIVGCALAVVVAVCCALVLAALGNPTREKSHNGDGRDGTVSVSVVSLVFEVFEVFEVPCGK